MADRYWVGGTENWDGTAGTKWAATSGGAGGESVPTSADDVFFDSNSSGTCTVASGNTGAKSVDCTGFSGGLTIGSLLRVYGDFTLSSGMTYTHTGSALILQGTSTVTTAGKLMGSTSIGDLVNDVVVTLADAWTSVSSPFARSIFLGGGGKTTFNTNNQNVTTSSINFSDDANDKTLNLGSSTITLGSSNPLQILGATNLIFNAGTSQINLESSVASIVGTGHTFHIVSFNGPNTNTKTISANNSFFELASTTPVAHTITFQGDQGTIGKWSITGSAGNVVTINSSSAGTRRNFTLTEITTNIDYLNVTDIGELSGNKFAVGFNSTNGGNNSNVYFSESPPGGAFFLF
jgi:hypothetical protein